MTILFSSKAAFSFALHLVKTRFVVKLAWGLAALTALAGMAIAVVLAHEGEKPPFLPWLSLMEDALAYGTGVLVAFGGAAQAFRRDRDEGIRDFLRLRGVKTSDYLFARTGGLIVAVALPTVGGTLAVGLVSMLVAHRAAALPEVARGVAVGVLFGLAFSVLVSLVSLAALGARNRAGGYLVLLALFGLPEMLSSFTGTLVPRAWAGLVSLPGMLTTMRVALLPGTFDGPLLVRAFAAIFGSMLVLGLLVRAELLRLDAEQVK